MYVLSLNVWGHVDLTVLTKPLACSPVPSSPPVLHKQHTRSLRCFLFIKVVQELKAGSKYILFTLLWPVLQA